MGLEVQTHSEAYRMSDAVAEARKCKADAVGVAAMQEDTWTFRKVFLKSKDVAPLHSKKTSYLSEELFYGRLGLGF